MIKVSRIGLFSAFMFLFSLAKSQETIIKVPFSQPKKLIVDAGDNQVLYTGQTVSLGTDVVITGGSPGFLYMWKDDGNNEYSTPTISVSKAGNYYLTVMDENHCTAMDSLYVALSSSIENDAAASGFSLFPNPSSGIFFISVKNTESYVNIEVVSTEGRVVFRQKSELLIHDYTGMIDLTGFDKGVYYVKLITTDGSLIKSILIQ